MIPRSRSHPCNFAGLGTHLERAADGYAAMGGSVIRGGERITSRVLAARIGQPMFERVSLLQAVTSNGNKQLLGPCLFNEVPVTFEYWWPHLGIALDVHKIPEAEIETKHTWCTSHNITYVGGEQEVWDLLSGLENVARERRQQRMAT